MSNAISAVLKDTRSRAAQTAFIQSYPDKPRDHTPRHAISEVLKDTRSAAAQTAFIQSYPDKPQITLHATAKRFASGYVPMITLRGAKGQMHGSRCPEGAYREFRTFTNEHDATIEARLICLRMAMKFPGILRASI